jgi:hypothetical protein
MMFNPGTAPGSGPYFRSAIEKAARPLKVEAIAVPICSDCDIESAMNALGRGPPSGVIATADSFVIAHRVTLILQAARNHIPVAWSRQRQAVVPTAGRYWLRRLRPAVGEGPPEVAEAKARCPRAAGRTMRRPADMLSFA